MGDQLWPEEHETNSSSVVQVREPFEKEIINLEYFNANCNPINHVVPKNNHGTQSDYACQAKD